MNWTSLMIFDWPTLTLSGVITSVCSGIIWWLKTRREKKIEHEFNKKLEKYKAELQEKAAGYQNDIQQKFEMFKTVTSQIQDRRTRSNEKEYDACIKVWNAINNAHLKSLNVFKVYEIIDSLKLEEVDKQSEFLNRCGIPSHIIEKFEYFVKNCYGEKKKFLELTNLITNFKIEQTQESIVFAKEILMNNSVFIEEELENRCSGFLFLVSTIVFSQKPESFFPTKKIDSQILKEMDRAAVIKKEILRTLRSNLHIKALHA